MENNLLTPSTERIKSKIHTIRGMQVMLDSDLAKLYDVETRTLNQAVNRNSERFPKDFMFQISQMEFDNLISQIVTSNRGGRRKLPYAFTEQGVAMLSGVLKSDTAIRISIQIINAFVAMRKFISLNAQIFQRLDPIEVREFKQSHDRFLIIDNKYVYHFGASLKDLGKKWFAFSKFDKEAFELLDKLGLR